MIGSQWKGYYLTAYGIAVKHGFEGTEEEWLKSLSAYGRAVAAGFAGSEEEWLKSLDAYGRAVAAGFKGTEEEWLASLKGENGATFTPSVSDDGVLSWTNGSGLENPADVNIKGRAVGIIKDVCIAVSGWVADSVGGGYVADVEIAEARGTMYPIVTVHPTSRETAVAAGTSSVCETLDGKIRFRAASIPTGDIYATVALIVHGGTGGSGGAAYLPIAGADTLGGIKIGDGLSVEADGTVSTEPRLTFTADGEVTAMLDEILGAEEE